MKTGKRSAAVAAAVVLGLSGCGRDDGGPDVDGAAGDDRSFYERATSTRLEHMTVDELEEATRDTTLALSSFRIRGVLPVDGVTTEMDLTLSRGAGCYGSMRQDSGGFDFVGLSDGNGFMKADASFLRTGPDEELPDQAIELMADRWIDMGSSDNAFEEFCDLESLLDDLTDGDAGRSGTTGSDYSVGEPRSFEGREVLPITGEDEDGETLTILVANDDENPRILRVESDGPEGESSLTFSEFDRRVSVEAPEDAVTLEDLREEAVGGPPTAV
ncbi:hypothetical protein [Streptomyces sp. GSL17-111]|uniref:hypothetical protein n=1 Tax=Streptomyces sp. GSL17-111 TaxID=3121596 RepID=UPI0030F39173